MITTTRRSGSRTCSSCEETYDGAFVLTVGGDVLVLCEGCLDTLRHTLIQAARRSDTRTIRTATLTL